MNNYLNIQAGVAERFRRWAAELNADTRSIHKIETGSIPVPGLTNVKDRYLAE